MQGWAYMESLPSEWFGFTLRRDMSEDGDVFDIFTYENVAERRKITVYYHDETKEYKLRVAAGLTEFCKEDFISPDLESLEGVMQERFERTLSDLAVFDDTHIDSLVIEKKILQWRYLEKLPASIEGFMLYIRPKAPFRGINGSYIIFDYSDFCHASNFILYYNIFRDEFFGEAKVCGIPEMNYLFDSHELEELEEKLDLHLIDRLKEIRKKINSGMGTEEF